MIQHTQIDMKAGRAPTPSISLCMMARDEEEHLARCLESAAPYVEEIILVDTGSKDRTAAVAESYGAKVCLHPWGEDFSKHRNQSISHARGDWILILDADEKLRDGDGTKLHQILSEEGIDSVMFTVVNFFNNGTSQSRFNQVRLFKRTPEIRYSGIVHNQLQGISSTITAPVHVHHYGYDLGPERMEAKFQRTSSLLRRRIREEPDNYRHYHDLAVSFAMNKRFGDAVEAANKTIELSEGAEKKGGVLILWTYFVAASSLLFLKDYEGAEKYALEALRRYPDHLDSHFVLVIVHHHRRDWKKMKREAEFYLDILTALERDPSAWGNLVNNTAGDSWRVLVALGEYFLAHTQKETAADSFERALKEAPIKAECGRLIGDICRNRSLWKEAACHYRYGFGESPDSAEDIRRLALVAGRLGEKDKAAALYRRALVKSPESTAALLGLGDLLYEGGEGDAAAVLYEKVLALEPDAVVPLLRLSHIALDGGDIEQCVANCERILRALRIPSAKVLESLSDLAELYLLIGHEFDRQGKEGIFREASQVALRLDPGLLQRG